MKIKELKGIEADQELFQPKLNENVTIEMTPQEFYTLMYISGQIIGDSIESPRRYIDQIFHAINKFLNDNNLNEDYEKIINESFRLRRGRTSIYFEEC